MAIESFEGKGYQSIIANGSEDDFAPWIVEVNLSVGGDTARAGMFVTHEGEITAGTATTHKDVDLAAAYNAANEASLKFLGIILRPKIRPENYGLNDTITDNNTVLVLLPTGGKAVVRAIYADNSDNVLPGQLLCLATGGKLKKVDLSQVTTTYSEANLQGILGQLMETVGVASAVAEDVAGTDIIVHMRY